MKLTAGQIRRMIPKRPSNSHKGNNGHVLVVAGSPGMPGAAILACFGALKVGAGLVTLASSDKVRALTIKKLPEVMTIPLSGLRSYVRRRTITTIAIGPGLGVGPAQRSLVLRLLGLRLPTVLDADGLNNSRPKDTKARPVIITPHPGELAKLLGLSRNKIQKNRLGVARETARTLGVVCVLKGEGTVISDGNRTYMNPTGNQAMATGGMGDVLTGVISGLLAQGLSLFEAACSGVYLHGLAGDLARLSDRGLLASEVAVSVPLALKKIGIK